MVGNSQPPLEPSRTGFSSYYVQLLLLWSGRRSCCVRENDGDTVLMTHVGSLQLQIGKASDPFPATIPHCIAGRGTDSNDSSVVPWLSRQEAEGCWHTLAMTQHNSPQFVISLIDVPKISYRNSFHSFMNSTVSYPEHLP